jgi:xanthine dehydrogenase small subunit
VLKFLLNNDLIQLNDFQPDRTLLEYLREDRQLTGTKEGCASGDCGACTVAVAELEGTKLRYYSINSCITFLGSLHGRQVITVEHLAQGDALHPVQQAMVDCHGSQCGFCTPGFVMSLFSLYKNTDNASRVDVETAIAGNLCRCTGYRPIVDAALHSCQQPESDHIALDAEKSIASLQRIQQETASDTNGESGFLFAHSLSHLAGIMQSNPQMRPVCGATDLALEVTQQLKELPNLVYVGAVPELNIIQTTDESFHIGAATRYSLCEELLVGDYPELGELLERLGSKPIRNQGSIGGNIANASPIGDMPPVLIALAAHIVLRKGDATRTILVEDFFLDYKKTALQSGEFIQSVIIPRAKTGQQLKIYKNSKRFDDDISTSLGVFNLQVEGNRVISASIAFGGMAAIPKRARQCESTLTGTSVNTETLLQAQQALANDFQPIADVRASAEYRQRIASGMVQRLFTQLIEPEQKTRVSHQPVAMS